MYPEAPDNQSQTDGKTIYGISKQVVTVIPNTQGTLDITPVTLAWWTTRTNTQESATLPGFTAQVAPGAVPQPSSRSSSSAGNALAPGDTALHGARSRMDILRVHWRWSAAGLALLIVVAAAGLWRQRVRRRGPLGSAPPRGADIHPALSKRPILRALRQACDGNRADAAAQALLDLGRDEWPDSPPRGLVALVARLDAGEAQVMALERHLYGGAAPERWDGEAVWRVAGRGLQVRESTTHRVWAGLDALYRLQASK